MTGTTSAVTATLTTVDTTRTAVFFSLSGGNNGSGGRLDDTSFTGTLNGSNGASARASRFTRLNTANVGTISMAWFAVSFFRCNTGQRSRYDTLCTLGGVDDRHHRHRAVVEREHGASSWAAPPRSRRRPSTARATPRARRSRRRAWSSTAARSATDTSVTQTGLTLGTTYFYKVWAKAGPAGSCTAAPCYIGGTEQS